jgi:hypothetical protein
MSCGVFIRLNHCAENPPAALRGGFSAFVAAILCGKKPGQPAMTIQLFGLVLDGPPDTCADMIASFRAAKPAAAVAACGVAPRLGRTPGEYAA